MDTLILLLLLGALFWACWHWFIRDILQRAGVLNYVRGRNAASKIPEEAYYEQASAEIRKGNLREGLWTKAWAESGGDTTKAQAHYIKLRVATMKDEVARKFSEEANAQRGGQSDSKTIVLCSQCQASLRLPMGKLLDTRCPRCSHEFRVDTRNGVHVEEFNDVSSLLVGRIGRLRFFSYWFGLSVSSLIISIAVKEGGLSDPSFSPPNFSLALIAGVTILYFNVIIARIRDIGHSSWLAILAGVPGVNFLLIFYLLVKPGIPNRNHYGQPDIGVFRAGI